MTDAPVRVIVNALLVSGDQILLARRSRGRTSYPGLWSFPGGHVEAGETLDQALVRETPEEIGVVPVAYSAVTTIADPSAKAGTSITYHMYLVTNWGGGEPRVMDDEHSELRWFPIAEAQQLPDLALGEYRLLLEALRTRLPG